MNNLNTDSILGKCGICALPLSIFPIHYHETIGNICGRCEQSVINQNEGIILERQLSFENLASKFFFYCPFRKAGCLLEIDQQSAKNHESTCLYKISDVLCPFTNSKYKEVCTWSGSPKNLCTHIRNAHKLHFRDPIKFSIDRKGSNEIIFSEYNSKVLMIICNYQTDLDEYHIYVLSEMNFSTCQKYKYIITIGNSKNFEILDGDNIEYMFEHFGFLPEKKVVMKVASFCQLFNKSGKTSLHFSFIQTNPDDHALCNLNRPSVPSEIIRTIMDEIRCPVCSDYMGDDIYSCLSGHNLCWKCERKLDYCPICKATVPDGRNFTLERIAKMLFLPCSFRSRGCPYLSTISKVKSHELNCLFCLRTCVFKMCKWSGDTIQLPEHLGEDHSFMEINQIYKESLYETQQFAFLYEDEIFLLFIKYQEGEYFGYSMNCLGGVGLEYKFQLEFIMGKKKRDVFGDVCEPLGFNFEESSYKFVSLPLSKIGKYLEGNVLTFRVQIERRHT